MQDTSNNNGKSKDGKNASSSSWSSWAHPQYILLAVVFLQSCFIVFLSFEGPSHQDSSARVSVHRSDKQLMKSKRVWKNSKKKSTVKKLQIPKATIPPQYKDSIQSKEWSVNSKAFPGALHFHFDRERLEPSFRKRLAITSQALQQQADQDAKDAAQLMVRKDQELQPCHYYTNDSNKRLVKEECFNIGKKSKGIIVYNSQPFPRHWCGKTIQPHAVAHMKKLCEHAFTEPPRLLLEASDKMISTIRRDLMKLPPIVMQRKDSYGSLETVKDCNVPCKVSMDTCAIADNDNAKGEVCLPDISDWTVEGTDFHFRYSWLDPRLNPQEVAISRKAYRENYFYVTRSFQSEIPLSAFDWDRYGEMKNAPRTDFHKSGKRGMAFFHLEPCTGEIKPAAWAGKVQEAFKGTIDYYGPCEFGNANLKPTRTKLDMNRYQDRQTIMSQYMFTFVIGHSQNPDMISELVWDALTAGSIPVYFGAPNIREHVPKNSVIVGGEYSSQKELAAHLDKVRHSRALWDKLHAWRDQEGTPLEDKYGFLKEKSSSSYCRMCRFALATKYSLGWNPRTQTIEKPAVDRKFCISPKDELKLPVEEIWMSDMGAEAPRGRKFCDKSSFVEQTISFDDVAITRKVLSHDNGIVDIAITSIESLRKKLKLVLRLYIKDIDNVEGAHVQHPHQLLMNNDNPSKHIPLVSSIAIQDGKTRATILTNWVAELKTPKLGGLVDILIKDLTSADGPEVIPKVESEDKETAKVPRLMKDEVLRIRVILEDVNVLRDAATEYNMSPYARLMITDFLDPLMFFSIK
ncbi:Alpha-(1,3)-fucosyltransferase 10 [Seminavis robusta]|uniref:Fucosyltransferase n=1 Tax=Seminavis robusta TaxID=568900 RepID=A0A9N8HJ55_9STRA|nr:Alpha-(1,3)-fucosyltransferase 10 [Seminavis robusta]|eukprot:Sro835_g208770.1 Alpha-(1,3)-fucosyltransferase 10 (799) ;mRNA; r:2094-4490